MRKRLAQLRESPEGEGPAALQVSGFHCSSGARLFPGSGRYHEAEEINQFRYMMIEREQVPLLPDPFTRRSQLLAVAQLRSEIIHGIEENSNTKLLCQCTSGDEGILIRLLQHRQASCCKGAEPCRVVQIIPVCSPDFPSVAAFEEVQPACVILGKLGSPAALVHVRM